MTPTLVTPNESSDHQKDIVALAFNDRAPTLQSATDSSFQGAMNDDRDCRIS
jgi:hypothetical protein